jgi:hypothetical protein
MFLAKKSKNLKRRPISAAVKKSTVETEPVKVTEKKEKPEAKKQKAKKAPAVAVEKVEAVEKNNEE